MTSMSHGWTCREVSRAVQAYVDGQADPATTARLEAHTADCGRCRCEVETFIELKRALRRQSTPCDAMVIERLRMFGRRLCAGEWPADD